jgi:predicted PurR-regulated permease PerM
VHPLTGFLRRRGAPMWLAATTTLLALVLVIFGLAASLALSVAQLAALIPTYQDSFTALVSDLRAWLGSRGMETLMASDTDAPVDLYIAAKNA